MEMSKELEKGINEMIRHGMPMETQVVTMTIDTAEHILEEMFGVAFHLINNEPKFTIRKIEENNA